MADIKNLNIFMLSRLDELLNSCTVKIRTENNGQGTGFFIAPYVILTCAHVLKRQTSSFVDVIPYGYTRSFRAEIIAFFPDEIDLALIRLQVVLKSYCVYSDPDIQPGDPCYAYGYTDLEGHPEGDPVTLECEGITGGIHPLIKLKGGQIRPGLSGSPLLNFRTGKVCGVISRTRNRITTLGGEAIPIDTVFEHYCDLIFSQYDFHEQHKQWSLLLDPDVEPFDSDWTYLDQAARRWQNYFKALWFLAKVLIKWFVLGQRAPRAFPFKTIASLIEHTLRGDLGQEIKRQRRELTQKLNLEVDLEGTYQARVLNELDSQAMVLINLINALVGYDQDVASTSRLLWVNEILHDQRSLIWELKENEGNSYPQLEAFKRRFKFLDEVNDKKYADVDRIIGKLVAGHTDTNFALSHFAKIFLADSLNNIKNNPKHNLLLFEKLIELLSFIPQDSQLPQNIIVDRIFKDLELEIAAKPQLKVLRKFHVLLKAVAGEPVQGGLFRAWSPTGAYHFNRKCKLYPERVQPSDMKRILCYETREEAERNHKPCQTCKKADIGDENSLDFLGEEPE